MANQRGPGDQSIWFVFTLVVFVARSLWRLLLWRPWLTLFMGLAVWTWSAAG